MPAWPRRCQGAVPRGAPGRAGLVAAAETGARSFPSAFLPEDGCFWGPHGVAPGSLGTGGTAGQGWHWPGCAEPRRDRQGDHIVARPDADEGECLGSVVFNAEVVSPGRVPSGARGWPASSVAGHRRPWGRVPRKTFRRGGGAPSSCLWSGQECSGEDGLRSHRGPRGQPGSPGTAGPAAGHAVGLLDDPSCRAQGSQQAPAKALEQDGHGDNGRTDGQGCGWRLCGRMAASSWLLGF